MKNNSKSAISTQPATVSPQRKGKGGMRSRRTIGEKGTTVNVSRAAYAHRRKIASAPAETLKFIPLGGLGEIGKNMYAIEYENDIVVIDAGLMFPDEEMLGIDFVIPDISYLEENRKKIRGILITHGHEDHIGALPFVLPKLDVPVYSAKLTLGMIEGKMLEAAPRYKPRLMEVKAGETISLGVFKVTFISVCHSIPDALGIAVETPLGIVLHTGDFKFDPTPVDEHVTDYAAFAELGRKGVLLMASDSTNAEREGFTKSEKSLSGAIDNLFRTYRNRRVIISAFASNLHRVQLVLDAAVRFNRKVVFAGRSMVNNVELAIRLGYIKAEPDTIVPLAEMDSYNDSHLVVMTTGSQGEPFSGLVLMSKGAHHRVKLGSKDVVALFANPIPGNEKLVSNTINRLFELGCEVLYGREAGLHVSGHASREELKMLLSMVKPKYFVPVHGEYRMQIRHSQLAEEVGIPGKNIFIMNNGDILSIARNSAGVKSKVQAGAVLVDGMALGEKEGSILKERQELSENGVLVVSITLDKKGLLVGEPCFESYGQIHFKDAEGMRQEFSEAVRRALKREPSEDDELLKKQISLRCKELLRKYMRSASAVIPLIARL
ncbi:ribonuclease J [Pyramidobacter piscolens]|uniref:ribonuclease J n=1 Tax=Pyramidobacter piscolens TaxID=638849 RepID=UPI003AB1C6E9